MQMNAPDLCSLLNKFGYRPLRRVHNAAHDAIIGSWTDWGLKNEPLIDARIELLRSNYLYQTIANLRRGG